MVVDYTSNQLYYDHLLCVSIDPTEYFVVHSMRGEYATATTNNELWQFSLGLLNTHFNFNMFATNFEAAFNYIIVQTTDRLVVLNAATGTLMWTHKNLHMTAFSNAYIANKQGIMILQQLNCIVYFDHNDNCLHIKKKLPDGVQLHKIVCGTFVYMTAYYTDKGDTIILHEAYNCKHIVHAFSTNNGKEMFTITSEQILSLPEHPFELHMLVERRLYNLQPG